MIKQEAEAQAVILRAEMREVFGAPGEQRFDGGGGVIAGAGAFEQAVKYSTVPPSYKDTGDWIVLATLGWNATRNGKKYGDWIFLEPDAVPKTPGTREKLLEVLQIQMENSLATIGGECP